MIVAIIVVLIAMMIAIVIAVSLIGIATTAWTLLAIVGAIPIAIAVSIGEALETTMSILIAAALGKLTTSDLTKADDFKKKLKTLLGLAISLFFTILLRLIISVMLTTLKKTSD